MNAPTIHVGIMSAARVDFTLHGRFVGAGTTVTGACQVKALDKKVEWRGQLYDELLFIPQEASCSVELERVTIGIDFHWERSESQSFAGALRLIAAGGKVTAINVIDVEQYLQSVISSEMSATAPLEYLKTHAVISRSWLLAQLRKRKEKKTSSVHGIISEDERIQWFDREDHELFDVCADDHCQRYQGTTRIVSPTVVAAVETTRGEVLTNGDEICDCRFHKCCGGATEAFENVWEPVAHPYLQAISDTSSGTLPALCEEETFRNWLMQRPEAFCNSTDQSILAQVLNGYDLETTDFYRWTVSYSGDELSEIIRSRSGIDFGRIIDLIPLERGASGRIIRLRIAGTLRVMTIGKELLIRRWLSRSHLYSSAFVVDKTEDDARQSFVLHGAGWGHGVGLCQIGAAVMCARSFAYGEILSHYYPQSILKRIY